MPRFLRSALVLIALFLALDFAFANREMVWVSLDPIGGDEPGLHMPLFAAVFLFVLVGIVIGGTATWFGQAKWRRDARERRREVEALTREVAELRASRGTPVGSGAVVPTGAEIGPAL